MSGFHDASLVGGTGVGTSELRGRGEPNGAAGPERRALHGKAGPQRRGLCGKAGLECRWRRHERRERAAVTSDT